MKLLKWSQRLPQLKITQPARGYGLGLLLIFALSSALVAASASFLMAPTAGYSVQGTLDESSAKQLAEEALDAAQIDILTQQRAGATITTAYRYPSSGTNTIAVPTYPGSGATTNKGTYYVTTTYARGFSLVLKANVAVGTSNLQVSRFMQLRGATPAPATLDIRFIGRNLMGWDRNSTGWSVSSAGDVNNDGYDDILIGGNNTNGGQGEVFLVFGRSLVNWTSLADVNGNFSFTNLSKANQTVRFIGRTSTGHVGHVVSSAGDVNNDGYDDILMTADWQGEVYLILGRSTANWNALTDVNGNFNLASMSDANQTVRFIGKDYGEGPNLGTHFSSAGDVNNDGYDDILLGAYFAAPTGLQSGDANLILGRSTADWATLTDASGNFNLTNMSDANQTVRFIARSPGDWVGIAVSNAGDVNNDGYDDVLIGASRAVGSGVAIAGEGEVYLIMGRSTANWAALTNASNNFDLNATSDANQTVRFIGRNQNDAAGSSACIAGDVNNDGYADIVIGAMAADGGGADSGEVYLIMGRSTANWDTLTDAGGNFNLDNMSKANQTVRFIGRNAGEAIGGAKGLSIAGDVNNDGYADILIGSPAASGGGGGSGEVYMILGRSTADWDTLTDASGNFNLDNMSDANQTVRFIGRNAGDQVGFSVNIAAGDVNNDGYPDIIMGAQGADGGGSNAGEAYMIMGRSTANWAAFTDASGDYNLDNI